MLDNGLKVVLEECLVIEPIGSEVAITVPNGDIVVLNETAGWILSRLDRAGVLLDALASQFANRFGIDGGSAARDVTSTIDSLSSLGIVRLCAPQKLSRRQFLSSLPDFAAQALAALQRTEIKIEPCGGTTNSSIAFRDALGAEVEIPGLVENIAPRGPFAHALVESIDPSLIAGANPRGMHASPAHVAKHSALKLGDPNMIGYLGRNVEVATHADIVLDVGSRLSRLHQANRPDIGVPIVRLVVPFGTLSHAYLQLYELTAHEKALELSALSEAVATAVCREDTGNQLRVFFAQGESGRSTRGRGTLVDEMLTSMGLTNAAHSMAPADCHNLTYEDVVDMRPDVIVLLPSDSNFEKSAKLLHEATSCPVHIVPQAPFPWLDRSPLAMQTIGALWLARVVRGPNADLDEAIDMCLGRFFGADESVCGNLKDYLERQELCNG